MSSTLPNAYVSIYKVGAVVSVGEYLCRSPAGAREVVLSHLSEQIFPGPILGPVTGAGDMGVGRMAQEW